MAREHILFNPNLFRIKLHFNLHVLKALFIKGYLRYKTIASQNGSSEVQVKNFFISWKIYVLFSGYSSLV